MNKKNKGVYIIIVVLIIVFLGIGAFCLVYKFNNNLYIKLNKKDLLVDRYLIGRNVIENIDFNTIESYLEEKFYISFVISKDDSSDSKNIKNGTATVEYTIKEKSLVLKIIKLFSSEKEEYTSDLEKVEYVMSFSDEKIKTVAYDNSYFYILTENGNIYRYRMEKISSSTVFEDCLFNFEGNNDQKFNKSDVSFGIDKSIYVDFKAKELVEYNNKIYAFTDDGKYMSLSPVTYDDYSNLEYDFLNNSNTLKIFNSLLIFNNNSNVRECTDFEINKCNDSNTYNFIKDNNGNIITVSSAIYANDNIYLIDIKGNLYIEKYDNNNIIIEKVNKYSENRVVEIVYFYKSSEPYMLDNVSILFDNGTRLEVGKVSRLNILISEKSKL